MKWLLDNWHLVIVLLGVLCYLINLVINLIKPKDKKNNILHNLANVLTKLPEIISMAEKVGPTGEERKTFAMTQFELIAKSTGVVMTDQQKVAVGMLIDNVVALTKTINNATKTTTITPVKLNGGTNNAN